MTKTLTKNKGGRPKIVLSKKQIEEVGELAKRLTTEQIADYLGIAQATFYVSVKFPAPNKNANL